jgi:ankyrin repeat protein
MTNRARNNVIALMVFAFVVVWMFMVFVYEERHDTALLRAISARDIQAARQAFSDGATMRTRIRRNFTFLQAAARQGNVEIAKLLVEHGAAATVGARNDDGDTALDIALANGHAQMADYLRSLTAANHAKDAPYPPN